MARTSKIEVFPRQPKHDPLNQRPDGHFIRVKASNGEIVLVSEMYDSKGNAKKAARRLKRVVANAVIVETAE